MNPNTQLHLVPQTGNDHSVRLTNVTDVLFVNDDRDIKELDAAFGPNESEYVKRMQFTLDGNMRVVVDSIVETLGLGTINRAFTASLNVIYHIISIGIDNSVLYIEKKDGSKIRLDLLCAFSYIERIEKGLANGKYQISLDEDQRSVLDDLQSKLGLTSTADVVRQSLMILYGISRMMGEGDTILMSRPECDYAFEI